MDNGQSAPLYPRGRPTVPTSLLEVPTNSPLITRRIVISPKLFHQILPPRIRKLVLLQKCADRGLEFVFAEVELGLTQERRGFAVDDIAVGGFCGGEVGDWLIYGGRPAGRVGGVGGLFV